jgi:hypothetical protein
MTAPAFSQTSLVTNATVGGNEYNSGPSTFSPADSTITIFQPDSGMAHSFSGWDKQPGQMPVLVPRLLPNSMSILPTPPVDEQMIVPMNLNGSLPDSTITDDTQKP